MEQIGRLAVALNFLKSFVLSFVIFKIFLCVSTFLEIDSLRISLQKEIIKENLI